METSDVEGLIRDELGDASVRVDRQHHPDDKSSGQHLEIYVQSERFRDKSRVERHRMIYGILDEYMGNEIHAVEITAETKPE